MYIERTNTQHLSSLIKQSRSPHNVLLIEGARQLGKTTMIVDVLQQFENKLAINLEEDRIFCADLDQTRDFKDFENRLKLIGFNPDISQILFIDEAQESSALGAYVRFMKERWPNTITILSGSSMSRLFRDNQRVPVGRVTRLKLNPLCFSEFLSGSEFSVLREQLDLVNIDSISPLMHEKLLSAVDDFLNIGGLPEVVVAYYEKVDYKQLRRSILLNQEDDFVRKSSIENRDLFRSAMQAVANHLGSSGKLTHIGSNYRKAKEVLSVMKSWHLILEVEQKGISSASSFHPKWYLYDIGIAQAVRNMPFPRLSILDSLNPALRTQLGGLFENLVYLELTSQNFAQADISGWKKNNKTKIEVDFIWRDDVYIPLECKAALKVTNRSFANLRQYLKESGMKVGVLVSAAPFQVLEEDQLRLINIPIYLCNPHTIKALISRFV